MNSPLSRGMAHLKDYLCLLPPPRQAFPSSRHTFEPLHLLGCLLMECILIVTPTEAKSNYGDKSASKKINPKIQFKAKYMRLEESQLLEAWSSSPLLQSIKSYLGGEVPRWAHCTGDYPSMITSTCASHSAPLLDLAPAHSTSHALLDLWSVHRSHS